MSNMNEETRTTCPRCKGKRGTIVVGQKQCAGCDKKDKDPAMTEMGMGAMGGQPQLPLGSKKEAFDRALRMAGDVNEAQAAVFLKSLTNEQMLEIHSALDIGNHDFVAGLVREHVIREAVRIKIREVVRKKKGGGGYTLYAPNPHKRHKSQPVGTFPTKLAAKRAELARFPPKDPKKLQRLRREITKLMKDPKKRAEAEKRAMSQKGTDVSSGGKMVKARKKRHYEAKIISKILVNEIRSNVMNEGLFREEAKPSQWDEFIKKVSGAALDGDKGFQRVIKKLNAALNDTLASSLKIIQQQLAAKARVKSLGVKKHDDGRQYVAFQIDSEAGSVGPIYVFSDNGVPKIEMSDKAKDAFGQLSPDTVTSIRGALSTAQDQLESTGTLRDLIGQRDQYLSGLEKKADGIISGMSPLQLSMLKRLLVKKYRGTK